jgi:hypothetical protein
VYLNSLGSWRRGVTSLKLMGSLGKFGIIRIYSFRSINGIILDVDEKNESAFIDINMRHYFE